MEGVCALRRILCRRFLSRSFQRNEEQVTANNRRLTCDYVVVGSRWGSREDERKIAKETPYLQTSRITQPVPRKANLPYFIG
jgi:hypothetical protein